MNPVVSVVLTAHNYEQYVGEALSSVCNQTLEEPYEVLVINDASTDNTAVVIEEFISSFKKSNPSVRLISNDTSKRLAGASNQGLSEARGEYVVRFDADDTLAGKTLETLLNTIRGSDAVYVFSDYEAIDSEGNSLYVFKNRSYESNILGGSPLGSGGIYLKADALRIGGYDESLSKREDIDFFIRLSKLGPVECVHEPFYGYRIHGTSMSSGFYKRRDAQRVVFQKYVTVDDSFLLVTPPSLKEFGEQLVLDSDVINSVEVFDGSPAEAYNFFQKPLLFVDNSHIDSGHVLESVLVHRLYGAGYVFSILDRNQFLKGVSSGVVDEEELFGEVPGVRLLSGSSSKKSFVELFEEEIN